MHKPVRPVIAVAIALGFAFAGATGSAHAAALAVGNTTVSAWGTMFDAPATAVLKVPTTITLPGPVVQVGSSNSTEYALLSNGQVWAWGLGAAGQLGDGGTVNSPTTPVQVDFPAGVTIASLATDAMPYNAALAIDSNGNAWGWGYTDTGALCSKPVAGPGEYALTPVELPFAAPVTAIAGASAHTIADANGSLMACGSFQFGSLGTGRTGGSYTPTPVVGMSNVGLASVYASSVDSGALLSDGAFYDWGGNAEDQLGIGTGVTDSNVPVQVALEAPAVTAGLGGDNTGNGSALVELSDGTLWAWGSDTFGQLGDHGSVNQAFPVPFTAPAGVTYTALGVAGATSYGLTATGQVYAWGQNQSYELGNGTRTNAANPVLVAVSGVAQLSTTAQCIVAL